MSSSNTPGAFDEAYDVYDPATFTTVSRPRQQPAASRHSASAAAPNPLGDSPSSVSEENSRVLRRTPRSSDFQYLQQQQQLLAHRRAHSVDASGHHPYIEQSIPVSVLPTSAAPAPSPPPITRARRVAPDAQVEDEEDQSTADDSFHRLSNSNWTRRSTHVAPTTASAILWTLEEAFRKPFPFTTDWEEVNAPMSDMVGSVAGPPPMGRPQGRAHNGAAARGAPVPINPQAAAPSGVRTPTDIMRQRREREGRRRAEQEAKTREQEEIERRRLQPQQEPLSPQSPAQPYAAGGDRMSQRRPTTSAGPGGQPRAQRTSQSGPSPSSAQPVPSAQPQQGQQHVQFTGVPGKPPGASPSQPQEQQSPRRPSFPHAFERWETLSSHWEGLTGYWIRKLEQNNQDLERDPLSQQMARQVTDLSAAGANLFHAVVELQRLRASSERKFQRWFFDTRSEQERSKELQADLERQVRAERQARTEAVASLQKAQGDRTRSHDMVNEMRRELQISKDEARRAWEELGRREQEERDRTSSLRSGEPTLVGGVQVVPMVTGLPNRQSMNPPSSHDRPSAAQYYEADPASPTGSDPFTEAQRKADNEPSSQGTTYPGHFYQPQTSVVHHGRSTSDADEQSYVGSSEPGDEEYSGYSHDPQGRPIAYPATMSEVSDDYEDAPVDDIQEGGYIPGIPSTSGPSHPNYPATTGEYSDPNWEYDSTPRHRHPTRLSDVIEEEEPRTTPSRASRASRMS